MTARTTKVPDRPAQSVQRAGRLLLLPMALAGCQPGVLDPVGPVGAAQRVILLNSLLIMLCIIVPTIVATLAFAWWFRANNPWAKRLPNWAFSGRIELVTWSIPLLTITLLGGVTWIGSHQLDPAKPLESSQPALEVQVVSLDWKWLFILPEQGIASVNQLTIPVGRPVHFSLTSASVLNSFFVPQLGSMIYQMNGMATQLNLQADRPGTYEGMSTHLSGDGFSDMRFLLDAVPPDRFDSWATATRGSGRALDAAAYTDLLKQSTKVVPYTYGTVAKDLFAQIVAQALPPGPGPTGQPGQAAAITPQPAAQTVQAGAPAQSIVAPHRKEH